MANKNTGRAASKVNVAGTGEDGTGSHRFKKVGDSTSRVVKQAAAVLDKELAAGIVAAKKMQRRFQRDRSVDPADFRDALERFQADAHELVTLVGDQLRANGNGDAATRLFNNTHDLVDLVVGFVNIGAEMANQLGQASRPKKDAG